MATLEQRWLKSNFAVFRFLVAGSTYADEVTQLISTNVVAVKSFEWRDVMNVKLLAELLFRNAAHLALVSIAFAHLVSLARPILSIVVPSSLPARVCFAMLKIRHPLRIAFLAAKKIRAFFDPVRWAKDCLATVGARNLNAFPGVRLLAGHTLTHAFSRAEIRIQLRGNNLKVFATVLADLCDSFYFVSSAALYRAEFYSAKPTHLDHKRLIALSAGEVDRIVVVWSSPLERLAITGVGTKPALRSGVSYKNASALLALSGAGLRQCLLSALASAKLVLGIIVADVLLAASLALKNAIGIYYTFPLKRFVLTSERAILVFGSGILYEDISTLRTRHSIGFYSKLCAARLRAKALLGKVASGVLFAALFADARLFFHKKTSCQRETVDLSRVHRRQSGGIENYSRAQARRQQQYTLDTSIIPYLEQKGKFLWEK